jgi:hypothetical protein
MPEEECHPMRHRISFFALFAAILTLTGCGGSVVKVNGVVKLDGTPVEGATVTFASEDGKVACAGFTDPAGNFSLSAGDKEGVPAGTYKVIVFKNPKVEPVGDSDPTSKDYLKMMEKKGNAEVKHSKGAGALAMPGMRMPAPGAGGSGGLKSELPSIYASASTTPITVKVPPDTQPVQIELKSKP